jgi:hypothetical protein
VSDRPRKVQEYRIYCCGKCAACTGQSTGCLLALPALAVLALWKVMRR